MNRHVRMEADIIEDGANYYFNMENCEDTIDSRKLRKKNLIGKYVVIVSSRDKHHLNLFLQDSRYGSGYWTKFIENARGFYNESSAIVKAKNLHYNNPRVAIIQANGKLKEVYSNGRWIR